MLDSTLGKTDLNPTRAQAQAQPDPHPLSRFARLDQVCGPMHVITQAPQANRTRHPGEDGVLTWEGACTP